MPKSLYYTRKDLPIPCEGIYSLSIPTGLKQCSIAFKFMTDKLNNWNKKRRYRHMAIAKKSELMFMNNWINTKYRKYKRPNAIASRKHCRQSDTAEPVPFRSPLHSAVKIWTWSTSLMCFTSVSIQNWHQWTIWLVSFTFLELHSYNLDSSTIMGKDVKKRNRYKRLSRNWHSYKTLGYCITYYCKLMSSGVTIPC